MADVEDMAKAQAAKRTAGVIRAVMDRLGVPPDFLRATIRPVTDHSYRVNVVVGPDAATARIAHSYFVTADADGAVGTSTPAITRCYERRLPSGG